MSVQELLIYYTKRLETKKAMLKHEERQFDLTNLEFHSLKKSKIQAEIRLIETFISDLEILEMKGA